MSRTFTGANTTPRLDRTLGATTPPSSGAFSVGCWVNMASWVTGRTFIITGTSDALGSGLLSGAATAQRFRLKVNCATTDMVVEVAAGGTGAWRCVVAVYNNSLTATNNNIYTGDLTTVMSSQAHVTDTNGSGAVSGSTAATIGKNSGSGTAIDGKIAQAFWVPWAMTLDEIERFRQGDWTALFRGGTPTFFVPMEGGSAATYDLAVPGAWTVTSTPTVAEDPPISFGLKPVSIMPVWGKNPALQSVSGGMTPAGALILTRGKGVTGAITPSGAEAENTNKSPSGALTPAGVEAEKTSKNPSGALTPTGAEDHAATKPEGGSMTPAGAAPKTVGKALTGEFT